MRTAIEGVLLGFAFCVLMFGGAWCLGVWTEYVRASGWPFWVSWSPVLFVIWAAVFVTYWTHHKEEPSDG